MVVSQAVAARPCLPAALSSPACTRKPSKFGVWLTGKRPVSQPGKKWVRFPQHLSHALSCCAAAGGGVGCCWWGAKGKWVAGVSATPGV